jgi:hypothetical protein
VIAAFGEFQLLCALREGPWRQRRERQLEQMLAQAGDRVTAAFALV